MECTGFLISTLVAMGWVATVVDSFLLIIGLLRVKPLGRPAPDDDFKGRLLPVVSVAAGILILLYGISALGWLR